MPGTWRAEVVGSLLRPRDLVAARKGLDSGAVEREDTTLFRSRCSSPSEKLGERHAWHMASRGRRQSLAATRPGRRPKRVGLRRRRTGRHDALPISVFFAL